MGTDTAPRPAGSSLRAFAWMLGALVSFSLVAIVGRAAAKTATILDLMFWRGAFGVVVIGAIVMATDGLGSCRTQRLGLHTVRNVIHFGAQFSWLQALSMIPLAQLFALEFTSPLWVAVLAPALIGERLTPTRALAAAVGFAGILIVTHLAIDRIDAGSALALASAIGIALSFIATKRLTATDSVFAILLYMSAMQTAISGVAGLIFGLTWPLHDAWYWLLAFAALGLTAHLSVAKAFANADAIIVAPMDLLRLPLIALIGVLVYAEPLDPYVLVGGAVVVIGNLINLWYERPPAVARAKPA